MRSPERLINCALYLAVYAACHLVFRDAIAPIYFYMGFAWDPSIRGTVVGGIATACLGLVLPARGNDFRSFMLHVMALFPVVPMAVLVGTSSADPAFLACALIGTGAAVAISRLELATAAPVRFSAGLGLAALSLLAVMSIVLVYRATGSLSFDLSMETIYANRSAHQDEIGGAMEYAHMAATRTVVPLLLVAALVYRRWAFVLTGVLLELGIFGVAQHRTALFAPFAILGCYWLARSRNSVQWLLVAYLTTALVGWLSSSTVVGFVVNEFIVRRVIFVPAMLNFEYRDLIDSGPFVWWSDSKLSLGFVDYPYSESVPYLIGAQIGMPHAHANAGWIGSGYMHAGVPGVLVYALLIGVLLAALNDRMGTRRDRFGAMAFLVSFLWIFMSSDPPAVMLTHGMLLGVVLFHLLGKLRRVTPIHVRDARAPLRLRLASRPVPQPGSSA